ncbi:MAG: ribonuclease H-like domain-containing protein [Candidatus Aenigmarchaeota archaeon]|nr:ribonuclease H-like domain-containing protein [Candidatus Aenigmarchaeota archaeon]
MLFQLLDVDYIFSGNRPIVRMFGRTDKGNSVCALYDRHSPYFYIKVNEEQLHKIKDIKEIKQVEWTEKSIPLGYSEAATKLLKIIAYNPQDVPMLRERLVADGIAEECYEADIMFKYRFLIDKKIHGMSWVEADGEKTASGTVKTLTYFADSVKEFQKDENAKLRFMAFDIECVPTDTTKPLDAKKDPIVMISLAFEPEYKGRKTLVLVAKPVTEEGAAGFVNENEMIEGFMKIIDEFDPDVITGYNINSFDIPYLLDRMKKLGLSATIGRVKDKQAFSRQVGMSQETHVPGRIVLDPYQILRRDPWVKFHRYNLDTIAKALLNEEKLDVKYGEMPELWNGNREQLSRFIEYSKKDALLSLRLVLEKGMLDKFVELAKISGLLLQDCFGGQSMRVETMIMHEMRERNYVMPPKPSQKELNKRGKSRDKEGIKGATVLEPGRGLHSEGCVLVLDFKSLYPSVMRTFNVSPDTLLMKKTEGMKTIRAPNGAEFVYHAAREGIMPMLLTKLMETRAATKRKMKQAKGEEKRILNAKQLAIKDMSNSVHAGTDIVVKEPSGNLRVCEVEELFNELSENHAVIDLGNTEVIELEGWKTLSVDGNKSCFKPIYAISRHKSKGDLTKIRTPMGEVMITDDHSIMVMEGKSSNRQRESMFKRLIQKGGKDVSEKDIIAQVKSIRLPEKEAAFNWLEFLKSLPAEETADIYLYIPKNLQLNKKKWIENRVKMLSALSESADSATLQKTVERRILRSSEGILINRTGLTTVGNCGLVPVYEPTEDGRILAGFYEDFIAAQEEPNYYTIPITAVHRLPRFVAEKSFIAVGGPRQGRRKIPVNIQVTEDLAELLGWFVAEGSTYKRNNSFRTTIANKSRQNTSHIQHLIKKCFGYDARLFNKDVTIGTRLAYLFFRHVCGSGSYTKQVPDFILNSNSRIRAAFMLGYYSGDGNTGTHRMNTVSKKLAAQLNLMLKETGGVQHNSFDGLYRISRRKTSHGHKIISGDLFGQRPEISRYASSDYVYDLSVRDTEMFVTAQGIVLHNSFYGYTGYIRARLYIIEVANAITAYGRENIMKTKDLIEKNFDVEVVYGDTDSIFLKTKIKKLDEAKNLGDKIAEHVTKNLPGHLELQFEKIYRTFLILSKKRYAGWKFEMTDSGWVDNIEMKGIETVRRDWCLLVPEIMENVIETILKEGDLQKAIEKVRAVIEDLRSNRVPLEKLTIVKGVTKSIDSYEGMLPHIELAKKLKARNPHSPPKIGDRLGFVIIRGNQMLSKRAEDPEYTRTNSLHIDSDYYINSQVFPPVERIFMSLGIDKSEVLGLGRQISLGDLMNGNKRKMKHEISVDYNQTLEGYEGFECKKCSKSFSRPPLSGSCECGGELQITYHGSSGDRVVMK